MINELRTKLANSFIKENYVQTNMYIFMDDWQNDH